ncbi:hypothetical protein QQS21_006652 [Conoideocrella luteorostrata]|uniref:Uncharacterized protein n=1 Tax=Conoideocrella luteorostrata TaxID=1105319 RepID=A0AAJ0G014_9HYPO|nr:hypothetical protein QQS21_006652 [Conoideocrella luteorostrata]
MDVVYIVNATSLIPVVQKQVQTLSFSPISVQMSGTIVGLSTTAQKIVGKDYMKSHSAIAVMHKITHHSLSPGPELDRLIRKAAEAMQSSLDSCTAQDGINVNMRAWVDYEVIQPTTDCVYGQLNPFRYPKVKVAWRDYETGLIPLLIHILPSLTASKHIRARDILVEPFESYLKKLLLQNNDTSALIAERFKSHIENGIPFRDIARIEVGQALGLISNVKPAAF